MTTGYYCAIFPLCGGGVAILIIKHVQPYYLTKLQVRVTFHRYMPKSMNNVTFIVLFLSNSVFTRIPTFYKLLVRAKNPSGTINFKIIQNATEARKCLSVIFCT